MGNLFDSVIRVVGRERFVARYYAVVYWWLRRSSLRGFNYGFSPVSDETNTESQLQDPFQIELYCQVAEAISPVRLRGQRVLEISCGLGGGFEHLRHRCAIGFGVVVDRSMGAVRSARHRFGLEAVRADARHLLFAGATFDVVLNIEASHEYFGPDFTNEVARVLAPAGLFALADIRPGSAETLRGALRQHLAPHFAVLAFHDISQNVADACERDAPRREAFMTGVPWPIRHAVRQWIGLAGAPSIEGLRRGDTTYFILVARRL